MLRKITAVLFLLVMALLITLKHPVLGYCLCLNSYFTGDCICEVSKKSAFTPVSSECAECCSGLDLAQSETIKPKPCDDCSKRLSVEVNDFVWTATDELPDASQGVHLDTPSYGAHDAIFASQLATLTCGPIRGDPPPQEFSAPAHSQGLPLYLRHSVLIL
ncbi:hypothetical protein NT6N_01990 [Oceaniferula spumae]|uniref:Uncharacterized protein n=1 Tax=Oceaniferula spumae TaxID=2979115 RepID=A0AAT9FGP9_9BACT